MTLTLLIVGLLVSNLVAWAVARVAIAAQTEARKDARHSLQRCIAADARVVQLEYELAHEKSLHRERAKRRSRRSSVPPAAVAMQGVGEWSFRSPPVLADPTVRVPENADNG